MINKLDGSLIQVLQTPKINPAKLVDCIVFLEGENFDVEVNKLKHSTKVNFEFPFIKAAAIQTRVNNLKGLIQFNNVKFIASSVNVTAQMNLSKQILKVPNDLSGKGITIAYIDTGISPHPDFCVPVKRIKKFVDFINYRIFPYDDNGHGTFVAGVGSGNGLASCGKFQGMAYASDIVAIKALNKNGEANSAKILEAMQWVYDNHSKYNIKVICMSFGSEPLGFGDPIMQGAEALWDKGITVVAAAGNSGPDYQTIKSPAISPKIITVGGFNDNRLSEESFNENFFEVAEFSSRGPALKRFKPDVIAPSVNINSCCNESLYTNLSGTSVATPMIAGICALILEFNKNLKPEEIKRLLTSSAKAITYNNNVEGFGIPNLQLILKEIALKK